MVAYARIKGWWKWPDGTVNGENLIAEIMHGEIAKSVQFPLERLPQKEWDQCVARLSDDGTTERICDEDLKRVCSAFEPQLLVRSDRTDNLRAVEPAKPSQPANAWHMREEFLRLKLDCEEAVAGEKAVAFLNNWGSWSFGEYALVSDMKDLQGAVRKALTSPPDQWFASDYSVLPMWHRRRKFPYFSMLTDKCEIAVRMTVTIDLLGQKAFKTCSRRDCGMPFEVTSKHKREYCRPYCAHLESMRRNRQKTQ